MGTSEKEYTSLSDRMQNVVQSLSKFKIEHNKEQKELVELRSQNVKLNLEIKEAQELEKSHRYHLQTSREMIANLQETISQLVSLKRDIKKLREEINYKDSAIKSLNQDKELLIQQHNAKNLELLDVHNKQIEELKISCEKKVQQVQIESDTQIAQFTCVIEELRCKIKEMEAEHRDKLNVLVLEYEEKLQRSAAQIAQQQEQLVRQASRTDSNIDAYRRRLEELEEKLKQSQFKQYLAQNTYSSQYENQVERPYSVNRDPFNETCSLDTEPVFEMNKTKFTPTVSQNKTPKATNTLKVMYYGNKTENPKTDKKGQFSITKKRKLYNDKDFQDF